VSFFVDPAIVRDREGRFVHTITLSYTFYEIDLPEAPAAPEQAALLGAQASGTPFRARPPGATETN
jgi:hypothetical protein